MFQAGERQRLKLATHMGGKGGIYVLDEPTSGLHPADNLMSTKGIAIRFFSRRAGFRAS